jgi:hypothetical protein
VLYADRSHPAPWRRSRQARVAAPLRLRYARLSQASATASCWNWSISGHERNGSDFSSPLWSMKITSRSTFQPFAIDGPSASPLPPGPPVRNTIGSGLGFGAVAFSLATAIRTVRSSARARFSGTVRIAAFEIGSEVELRRADKDRVRAGRGSIGRPTVGAAVCYRSSCECHTQKRAEQ